MDQIVWSHAEPARACAHHLHDKHLGLMVSKRAFLPLVKTREAVRPDNPRVEAGPTYVMTLVWTEGRCSPGDPTIPARWLSLGESVLPFDAGVIGEGEMGGEFQTAEEARTRAAERAQRIDIFLKDRVAGQPLSALREELKNAEPRSKEYFEEPEPSSPCR